MQSAGSNFMLKQRCILWILLAAAAILMLATFQDYGVTWDEHVQSLYGELVVDYFKSGFKDLRCNSFIDLYLYGPLVEAGCALVYGITGWGKYEVRHFLIACTALLTLYGLWKIAGLFPMQHMALFVSLALLMLPRFYGHMFNNSKDIPFACAFTWAMFTILHLVRGDGKGLRPYIYCGLAIGAALAIRVGGLLLICFCLAGIIFRYAAAWKNNSYSKDWIRWCAGFSLMIICAWAIMVACWPWSHEHFLFRPIQAFFAATNFDQTYPVLFNGMVYNSADLPWYYLPKYLLITTPEPLILFSLCGIFAMIVKIFRKWSNNESVIVSMVLLWLFFPLLFVIFKRPNIYDGIRHFIFVLPAVAVACGYGAAIVREKLATVLTKPYLATLLVMTLFLLPVKDLVLLHPYQMTYFNSLVGGVGKAWQSYETDYWVSSYKEAAEWINVRKAAAGADKMVVILGANGYSRHCAEYYLDPDIEVQLLFSGKELIPETFDYYVGTLRYGLSNYFPELPTAHVIGRQGAVYTVIKAGPSQM